MQLPTRLTIVSLIALTNSACSFVFVHTVPSETPEEAQWRRQAHETQPAPPDPGRCTSGKAAPVIDTLIGGFEVVRTGLAAGTDANDSVYRDGPISRNTDLAAGIGLSALFIGSAIYGYVMTSECSSARAAEAQYLKQKEARAAAGSNQALAPAPPAPNVVAP
jgi:hypothetical protein